MIENAIYTLLVMLPFLLAVLLANAAERNNSMRVLQYIYLFLLNGLWIIVALLSLFFGVMLSQGILDQQPGLGEQAAALEMFRNVDWTSASIALLLGSTIALIVLIPAVRRVAARIFPINPDSIVHVTALSLTATVFGGNLFQMSFSSGLLTPEALERTRQFGGATYLDILIFPLLVLSLAALFGVGWLTRRTWPQVMERLALVTPTLKQLGLAVGVTVALFGLAVVTDNVWQTIDAAGYQRVGGVSEALMGNFTGLLGAFAIGFTAAVGEESFFRGAYQPRMGIVMASLFFASFHVQYFISLATLLVFVIGLVLGVLRQRTNLTVCILVHFLYNFTSVLLSSQT